MWWRERQKFEDGLLYRGKDIFESFFQKIESSKNELVSTNKTEDTSKMKCSICKQEGHNKRSCKKMPTLVSAPKIEAETDVKVEPPVKVEMTENYLSIIQKALDSIDSNIDDTTRLTEKCGDSCIKIHLDNLNKSRATQGVAIASLVAKHVHPDWDTRLHEIQIGGKRGLRGISGKVNAELHSKGLLLASTDYATLSPAFKGVSAPFNKDFKGSIKPRESLSALLSILELINTTATPEVLSTMLQYILLYLTKNKKRDDQLKESKVVSSRSFSIIDTINTLNKLYDLGNGSSKLPVIAVFTTVLIIQPYLWPKYSIVPLKEHTEADKGQSCGDVEVVDSFNKPMIAFEIKHNLPITKSVIKTFDDKTSGKDIPLRFILSTKKDILEEFVNDNISIKTLDRFVSTYLHMALSHEKDICSIFLHELKKNIVNHTNLNINIKESADEILTSLLVSPSL